jgi:hypothetical protein
MITGAHFLLYSKDPDADRLFFRDILESLADKESVGLAEARTDLPGSNVDDLRLAHPCSRRMLATRRELGANLGDGHASSRYSIRNASGAPS